jgi:soluble lytic murein transglycosylase
MISAAMLYFEQKEAGAISFYGETVTKCAFEFGIDANLIFAVIKAESNFDENASSGKGAKGLMQIMPQTADFISAKLHGRRNESDLFDYKVNIRYGTYYLRYLTDKYDDLLYVLTAYNAGEGNLDKWLTESGGEKFTAEDIPFGQTREYVKKTLRYYKKYKNKYNY